MHHRKTVVILALLALAALGLAACTAAPAAVTQAPAPTCPAVEPAAPCPTAVPPVVQAVPNEAEWAASPHNMADAEAFKHWDETEDKMVPANCAACHSTTGFMDFVGADGSEAGKVDNPVAIGTTIECQACHNPAAEALSAVTFPSGIVIEGLGGEARCMTCHQGRAAKATVDAQIEQFKVEDPDKPVEPIVDGDKTTNFGFINIHYYAAAATLYGSQAEGGYEYEGKTYDSKFMHVPGYATCTDCHNSHSTELKLVSCAYCHEGVTSKEDLRNVRMISSSGDYDGDGDVAEGMASEIAGLQEVLYASMQAYAKDVAGAGLIYDGHAYPYMMLDADNNGEPDTNDKGGNIAYNAWTARLLKAAYNYQVSMKDPGAYAHGNKYIVQLLHDSIEDLNEKLTTPVDLAKFDRDDAGHFAGNAEAFRHWDAEDYTVPATCAKCHSATGMAQFIQEGANISNPASNGFTCYTCHNHEDWPNVYAVTSVPFPSGVNLTFSTEKDADGNAVPVNDNLCLECHQGRESTVSVNKALAPFKDLDAPDAAIRFRNVHYFAAGATLFGTEAKGIYEYEGKTYAGAFQHEGNLNKCSDCHDAHVLTVKVESCKGCHGTEDVGSIRMTLKEDYDGDGDTEEGLQSELVGYQEALYAAMQEYATTTAQAGILYDSHAYPYFFVDNDNDGKADLNDKGAPLGYNAWTPRLMRAAYNYQYSMKDPGAFAHNFVYVAQALYDSIQDLHGDTTKLVRPEVQGE